MRKITGKKITAEQIEMVNEYLGYEKGSRELSNYGYAFYYNQINNSLDPFDADRYANLNTILGYDVGIVKFRSLESWLYEHDFDLIELNGSDTDKAILQEATKKTRTKELDYSKWTNYGKKKYLYSYFENGEKHK